MKRQCQVTALIKRARTIVLIIEVHGSGFHSGTPKARKKLLYLETHFVCLEKLQIIRLLDGILASDRSAP